MHIGADRESTSAPAPLETLDLLRALAQTLTSPDFAEIAAYVALSLAAAFAGSIAAVVLVPLVQPEQSSANVFLRLLGDLPTQAAAFVAVGTGFAFTRWQAARLGARLVGRYGMRLRRIVHAHLIDARLTSMADSTSAEIANVLTYNVEIINQGFAALLQLLIAGISTFVSLGFTFCICPQLMLAAPMFALIGATSARAWASEQAQVSRRYVADMTELFWLSEDFPRRLRHVRSFGREDAEKAHYGEISARLRDGGQRQLELAASGRLLIELVATVGIAAILAFARVWQGIDQASLIATGLLVGRLLPYLISTRQSLQQLRSAAPAFALWQCYTNLESDRRRDWSARESRASPTLRIERVRLIARALDAQIGPLTLAPGEMTLICGDSGIGKSSLLDVLSGMVQPIIFDARAGNRSLSFGEYREHVRDCAYISQSVCPWQRSVRECLLWADPDASDDMLWSALTDVGLDARLLQSQGLDTLLYGASNRLSGGELQRLLLAQVMLKRPLLALLDEATSALDPASERAALCALRRGLPETILIVVSHRPDLAAIADQCLTIADDTSCITIAPRSRNESWHACLAETQRAQTCLRRY